MNETEHPIQSPKTLLKAVLAAIILAIAILMLAVLPAEYGIDPTGLGKKMGLTALAPDENNSEVENIVSCEGASEQNDTVEITVPAMSGLEYKFHMQKGTTLAFDWRTDGAALFFDFHGEPQGDKTGYFKSYEEATKSKSTGTQIIPFTGSHGWYWKNESSSPITLVLNTKGEYQVLGRR